MEIVINMEKCKHGPTVWLCNTIMPKGLIIICGCNNVLRIIQHMATQGCVSLASAF
jgi:hypothetical protein